MDEEKWPPEEWQPASQWQTQPEPLQRTRSPLSYFIVGVLGALIGGAVMAGGLIPHLRPVAPGQGAGKVAGLTTQLPPVSSRVEYSSAINEVAEQVGPAVVGIGNYREARQGWALAGSGSGVLISADGVVVTNHHVIEGADGLSVSLSDGRKLKATLVGTDPSSDIAVLRLEEKGPFPFAAFGDSDSVRVGDLAIAIGNPLGEEFERTVTSGIISGLNRTVPVDPTVTILALQTDAAINPGNSGGALLNAAGQLIGINSAKVGREDVEGLGFAIPSNQVRPLVEKILATGKVVRPLLGIQYMAPQEAAWYHGVQDGLLISSPVPGGPAEKAGIRAGDILIGLGDREIHSVGDLMLALRDKEPNQTVPVRIERDGKELTVQVTLAPGVSR